MDLFVYGTLQNQELMQAVAGGESFDAKPAVLPDYAVLRLTGNVVPKITPKDKGRVSGLIFCNLSADQIARLDLFEGAFGYFREEKQIIVGETAGKAQVYLPPVHEALTGEAWSLTDWEVDHLKPMLYAAEELFAHDPLPDQRLLRRMWPMIEKRAWARLRAETEINKPAVLRHDAQSGDFKVHRSSPPLGNFFRLQSFQVSHRTFAGSESEVMDREVHMGVDAALVLPYDPKTGFVMVVEQARMGPLRRGDKNPWQLEPIAGMTDARESPEEAARREAKEEAGIDVGELGEMFGIYASPGGSTDYFKCYCAPCDLPGESSYLGGLDEENEDLRMHILPLTKALDLIESGEINAGPLVAMLYWLDRNKARYHSDA